jgi:hypothetical protein
MKILLIFILSLVSICAFSQSTLPLRADTVVVEKVAGSGEFKLKNSTRDTTGILTNIGGGRTQFRKPRKINDTCIVIGLDTICGIGGDDLPAQAGNPYKTLRTDGTTATWENTLDWVDARTFGADPTGVLNSTTAIQNAINSLPSTGGVLYFGPGTFKTDGNIHVTRTCRIIGASGTNAMGWNGPQGNRQHQYDLTKITCTSDTANLFIFDSSGTIIEYCSLINTSPTTPTQGSGIKSMRPSTKIMHCAIAGFYDNVYINVSPEYYIEDVFFSKYVRYGLYHRTDLEPDAGDQVLTSCWFYPRNHNAASAIYVESGGGLKISDCKFNANSVDTLQNNCITVLLNAQTTVDLLISNCSFENYLDDAINIRAINAGQFHEILITGNQFAPNSANADGIVINGASGTIASVAITGNVMKFTGDTAVSLTSIAKVSFSGNNIDNFTTAYSRVDVPDFSSGNMIADNFYPAEHSDRFVNGEAFTMLRNSNTGSSAFARTRILNDVGQGISVGIGSVARDNGLGLIESTGPGGIRIHSTLTASPIDNYIDNTLITRLKKDSISFYKPVSRTMELVDGSFNVRASIQNVVGSFQISANAKWDGDSWERYSIGDPSWNLSLASDANLFSIRRAASGAGSITWTNTLTANGSGEINIGNFTDQGAYTLQNTGGLYQNGLVSLNLGSDATGDTYYRNSGSLLTRLPIGTTGQVLTVSGGVPAWSNSVNIATASLTANNDYIQNWNNKDLRFDSIKLGRLFSYGVPSLFTGGRPASTLIQLNATNTTYPLYISRDIKDGLGNDSAFSRLVVDAGAKAMQIITYRENLRGLIGVGEGGISLVSDTNTSDVLDNSRISITHSTVQVLGDDSLVLSGVIRPAQYGDSVLSLVNITHSNPVGNRSNYKVSYVPTVNTQITKDSASGVSSVDINLSAYSSYDRVVIYLDKVEVSNNGVELRTRFSNNGGSSFASGASDYEWLINWRITPNGAGVNGDDADDHITLVQDISNVAGHSASGEIELLHCNDASYQPMYKGEFISSFTTTGAIIRESVGGRQTSSTYVNAISFFPSAGTFDKFKYRIIGYKN